MDEAPEVGPRATDGKTKAARVGVTYGLINFVVCVPTLISYAAIVFHGREFDHDMPSLTKLFFLSSAVHQFVFTCKSTLKFAIGQVQDVGLIFLAQIAAATYEAAKKEDTPHDAAVATVLVALALATVITGSVVWVMGKLRLSGYVQLLPLPVVGGYLGYIGYFCLAAGASLGTGLTVDGFTTWSQFFLRSEGEGPDEHLVFYYDPVLLTKLSLSVAFAFFLFYISRNAERLGYPWSEAALPMVLIVTPIIFFVVLFCAGIPLDAARDAGWIPYPDQNPAAGWQCFGLYNNFQDIGWDTMPSQLPLVAGLFCVVAFGSVLDVAAIQAEQPKPLDFDGELRMIGMSNFASGCFGGFTGSYIFSQTVFSQRQGVDHELNGLTIGIGEFLLFLAPVDILQFFPGFYVGGIMAFFGLDIMLDWLVHSRSKVSSSEYGLLLLTFLFVMQLSVITGCVAGVAACAIVFIAVYSTTPAVAIRSRRFSSAQRSGVERMALLDMAEKNKIVSLEFKGYLFFGASLQLSDKLICSVREMGAQWVVMDLTLVNGIDSTSARALSKLLSTLKQDDIRVSISKETDEQMHRILKENGALPSAEDIQADRCHITDSLDHALAWCERGALRAEHPASRLSLAESLDSPDARRSQRDLLLRILEEYVDPADRTARREDLARLANKMTITSFKPKETIFAGNSRDFDGMLFIMDGRVECEPPANCNRFRGKFTCEPGSLMGEVDFYLREPHHYTAKVGDRKVVAGVMFRDAFDAMEREEPKLASLLKEICLRSACMLSLALEALRQR